MKGHVVHDLRQTAWEEVPDLAVGKPSEAAVRVDLVTIYGTVLHTLEDDVPGVQLGTVGGHEAVGEIVGVGSDVQALRPRDRVLVSRIGACGRCRYCREGACRRCMDGGGWNLGLLVDGTQVGYLPVFFADQSVYALPCVVESKDVIPLADIFPSSYGVGVPNGCARPGDTAAVVGSGLIGLVAIASARLFASERMVAVDLFEARLGAARRVGTDAGRNPEQQIADPAAGLGADVVVEAVGVPDSSELGRCVVRLGGHVADIGVQAKPVTLRLKDLWIKNVTITAGLEETHSTLLLLSPASNWPAAHTQLMIPTFQRDQAGGGVRRLRPGRRPGVFEVVLSEKLHVVVAARAA
ncbi:MULTISPECIES: alcohol dehydrogenase catalytic domain-containing protein [unclassified Streptomyces]|uniref:alcohol dehydrogenase catalytic domain-containing protein n=1 Tax=unclassified Streptomyces TaxID=2593676 RepID=UPI002E32E91E|nr:MULTISPECIES: alcohol dehydrogenase catalytic domain-containing protein [unclassified Streptomyces]